MRERAREDLRQRRAKTNLVQALLELMEERPFHTLTVVDIRNRAMVHRPLLRRGRAVHHPLVAGEGYACGRGDPDRLCGAPDSPSVAGREVTGVENEKKSEALMVKAARFIVDKRKAVYLVFLLAASF